MATNLSSSSIFNPDQKDEPLTYYGGLAKPISDPKAYSATAEAINTGAKVTADVVKVAHTLTQQDLDDRIHNKIDAIRDPYAAQLSSALDEAKGAKQIQEGTVTRTDVQGNPIGPRGTLDILSEPTGQVPKALDDLTPNLTALQGARANKKISKTDYDARLDALAKDFRRDFPGWRDYIDAKFQSITGENPANAVIRSRIQDINSWVAASKSEQDKILGVAMREENLRIEGMPERIQIAKATGNYDSLLKFIQENTITKRRAELAEQGLNETKFTLADKALQSTKLGEKQASQRVTNYMDTLLEASGISTDPAKAQATFEGMDPAQAQQTAQLIRSKVELMRAQIRADLHAPIKGDSGGNSKAFYMGPDAVNKTIDESIKPALALADYLDNKQNGLAFHYARMNQAWQDTAANQMLGTKKMGDMLREGKVFEQHFGSQALAVIIPKLMTDGISDEYKKYKVSAISKKWDAVMANPDPVTGAPRTLKDDVLEARKQVMTDPELTAEEKPKIMAKLNETFISQIRDIQDPTIPADIRKRYVERAYSEEGKGLIAQLERDGIGTGGKKGKFSVYNDLYSDEQTAAIAKLGGKHWEMYKDSAQSAWSNELLKPELRSLNSIIIQNPNVEITWNDKEHKFGANFGPATASGGMFGAPSDYKSVVPAAGEVSRFTQERVGDTVRRLNSTLQKYATIAKSEGADAPGINNYVLRTLSQAVGNDPGAEPTAANFFKAVLASRPKPEPTANGGSKKSESSVFDTLDELPSKIIKKIDEKLGESARARAAQPFITPEVQDPGLIMTRGTPYDIHGRGRE